MEAILVNDFNLNIKEEVRPHLHGNELLCYHTKNFSHVFPKIDSEILYRSPEIEENNNYQLLNGRILTKKEIEEIKKGNINETTNNANEKIIDDEKKESIEKIIKLTKDFRNKSEKYAFEDIRDILKKEYPELIIKARVWSFSAFMNKYNNK